MRNGMVFAAASERRRVRAFTLVELLVVTAMLAGLVAVLLPSLAKARRQAAMAVCGGNLRQVGIAFTAYVNDHRDRYPAAMDPVSTTPRYWLWMGRGFRRFLSPYLVRNINANNPNVLACPADATPGERYEKTSYAYSMTFYHSPAQINGMSSVADTYSTPQPPVAQGSSDVRHPARKALAGEWQAWHDGLDSDNGWWDKRGTRAFLFADTHVARCAASAILTARDGLPDPNLTIDGVRGLDVR